MECTCTIDNTTEGEEPDCFVQKIQKARKTHICGECGKTIKPAEQYENYSGIWDGAPGTHKTCMDCLSLRKEFFRSWQFRSIWDDFCDQMHECGWYVPESCLAKVTPRTRTKICELIENYWEEE